MRKRIRAWLVRRWVPLAVVVALLVVPAILLVFLWPPSLEERVRRVVPGMTEAEVDAVMGAPAGNYSKYAVRWRPDRLNDPDFWPKKWYWDDAVVEVRFGVDGRVKGKHLWRDPDRDSLLKGWFD
jgi:hypothetical protein